MKPGDGPQLYAAALSAVRETTHLCPATYIATDLETARAMAQEYERHQQAGLHPPERWRRVDPPPTEEEQP